MISLSLKTVWTAVSRIDRVLEQIRKDKIRALQRTAFAIRKTAQQSIRTGRRGRASAPGTPPHTRRGQLRRSILYAVDKDRMEAVIGPASNLFSDVGGAHEYGGIFRGQRYPARPFMGPALEPNINKFTDALAGSMRS